MIQRRDEIAGRLTRAVGDEQAAAEVDLAVQRTSVTPHGPTNTKAWCIIRRDAISPLRCRSRWAPLGFCAGRSSAPWAAFAGAAGDCGGKHGCCRAFREVSARRIGDVYQLLDTSDVPGGVVNLVAGRPVELAKTLAEHDGIDAIWCFRSDEEATLVRNASVGNMKQVWTNDGHQYDWFNPAQAEGRWFLQHSTQVKNIWVPYGE